MRHGVRQGRGEVPGVAWGSGLPSRATRAAASIRPSRALVQTQPACTISTLASSTPARARPVLAGAADQRIDERIGQAHRQQQQPELRQRHAVLGRVERRQAHVERQRQEGQRQAEQADAPGAQHRRHGDSPSSCARISGSEVCGASQMPKKRRLKAASKLGARGLPLNQKRAPCAGSWRPLMR